MSALLVDTSSWISYFKSERASIIDEALSEGRVYLSGIVAAELTSATLSTRERRDLESFLGDLPLHQTDLQHLAASGGASSKALIERINRFHTRCACCSMRDRSTGRTFD